MSDKKDTKVMLRMLCVMCSLLSANGVDERNVENVMCSLVSARSLRLLN